MTMESSDAKDNIRRFYALQEERVQTYGLFEEGFQAYLQAAPNYNFNMYKQLVHEVTEAFNKISKDIISIESEFKGTHNRPSIAAFIRKIQNEEKRKLELTAKLQLATQNVIDHPDDNSPKQEMTAAKEEIEELKGRISELLEELKYEAEDLYT